MHEYLLLALGIGLLAATAQAAAWQELPPVDQLPVIKDLPDPFVFNDGSRVKSKEDWARRREELKSQILYYEYGHWPPAPGNVTGKELSSKDNADLGAVEKQILLTMGPDKKVEIHLDLTIPAGKTGPLPVFVKGDLCWGKVAVKQPEAIKDILRRGYILAEFDRTELAPDSKDRTKGVYPVYPDYDWAAEAAWAWGFQRVVDYLLTQDFVDSKHIAVTGHSRGGKAALLAGAFDERVALVAPNGSGAGGAGLHRIVHPKGETTKRIVTVFPFWFSTRMVTFLDKEDRLPFDQHSVRALCAPRAHLCTEALDDLWANPTGTQQGYLAAKEVYDFLGASDRVGISFRPGKHEQDAADWAAILDFADKVFFGKAVDRKFDTLTEPDMKKAFSWSAPKP